MDIKFTHSLKMNAVPEWWNSYISYENLVLLISKLEQERQTLTTTIDEENTITLQELDSTFLLALNTQLEKVAGLFIDMETSLYSRLDSILHTDPWNQQQQQQQHSCIELGSSSISGSSNSSTILSSQKSHDFLLSSWADLQKKQLGDMYISLINLTTFVELNWTGFDKILSEYDQHMNRQLRTNYLAQIKSTSHPFMSGTMTGLCNQLERLLQHYAYYFCHDSIHLATRQMNAYYAAERINLPHQQDQQWKQHPSNHDNGACQQTDLILDTNNNNNNNNIKNPADSQYAIQSHYPDLTPSVSSTGNINNSHPTWSFSCCGHVISIPTLNLRQHVCLLFSVVVFVVLMNIDCFGNRQENYCFALLVFAAVMWATEAIPLYATSMGLPFLIVILGVMRNEVDGLPMPASVASKTVFSAMFSSTIMMLLGGFALAAAVGKYGIAKAFATHVLSRAGTRPRWILLAIMLVSGFLSMWISNVATPVLCYSLIEPILRTLPSENDDDDRDGDYDDNDIGGDAIIEKIPKHAPSSPSSSPSVVGSCLILGIALGSCIGGMTSPISSPQNIITLQYMNPNPGWGAWFMIAMPISILCIFICWFLLLLVYRPDRAMPHLKTLSSSTLDDHQPTTKSSSLFKTQIAVMAITVITIALWCAETTLVEYLGSTGIVATLPLFLFFGTGLLNKEDLNGFLWSVVVLAQGGMALGEAVTSSGLLQDIALRIKGMIVDLDVIVILTIFSVLMLVFATFVSHTVAALIIIPIVQQVGQQLPTPHPNLLVMGAGLACSAGMGLPVSGYPNMFTSGLEDRFGKPYLTSRDFIITGIPTSIFCCLLVVTMGYGMMVALGF
ncbi:unnamed protein product [Absidia cylindrospora]